MVMETAPKPKGKRSTKILLYGGGAAALVVVYIAYSRAKANSAATADTTSADAVDPNTGIPYADESGSAATGYNPYAADTAGATTSTSTLPTTNAEWAQNVENYLTGLGYDAGTVSDALGSYLGGTTGAPGHLTSSQYQLVQDALAFGGTPPQSVVPPTVGAPVGQTSANNVTLAQLRATYDADLSNLRAFSKTSKPNPTTLATMRQQVIDSGAAYTSAVNSANGK